MENILQNIIKNTPKRYWSILCNDYTVIGEIPIPIYNYSYKKTNFSFKVLLECDKDKLTTILFIIDYFNYFSIIISLYNIIDFICLIISINFKCFF